MADTSNAQSSAQNKRTILNRVVIDTPALLNLIKHCRESDNAARGHLMGVLVRESDFESANNSLKVTQTMPHSSKQQMTDLM
jgi:uncharacterized protein YnzC (UPF0291/DUF896 family)